MKKIFTLAAAVMASLSMMAALPLNSLPVDTTMLTAEFWGSGDTKKNVVIYDEGNYIMMMSQGNALSFDENNGAKIGNSSKASAFVFHTAAAADITLQLSYNGTATTVTLYYMGESVDELTSSNLATAGTQTCASVAVESGDPVILKAKACAAGYYKVVGANRFCAKYIALAEPTPADHSKATLTAIYLDGESLTEFSADQLSYNKVLDFDATAAPTITAETGDDATVAITQASAVDGSATIVCTSYDQTEVKTYTVNFSLESPAPIIRATLTSGSEATVKGSIGGTADVNLSSNKKMDKGKYFGIALAEGNAFQEGDSVVITMSAAGGNYPCLFEDKDRTNCLYLATEGSSALEYSIILPAAADGITTLYLARDGDDATYKWNPVLTGMSVYRPVDDGQPKLNVSVDAVEVAVTAEEDAPSAQVVFSGKNLAAGTYNLTVPSVEGMTVSPTSVTVGDDGKLNATVTIAYASDVDVAEATANLSLTIGELTKSVVITYSAVHGIVYSTSVNIEQLVLDNGKSYDWQSAFAAANIEYAHMDALDSLNDEKDYRNEPYLGLKMKNVDGYLKVGLPAGTVLNMKFGNVADEVTVTINGVAATSVTAAGTYTVEAQTEDAIVTFNATTKGTVVFKQIMVGEEIKEVVLPPSPVDPTAIDNTELNAKSVKMIENGQLVIIKNGVKYNAQGAVVE